MDQNTAKYLTEVLGIRHLPIQQLEPESYTLVLLSQKEQNKDELELIQRMMAAMKLESLDWALYHGSQEWSQALDKIEKSKVIVIFDSELFDLLRKNYPHWLTFHIPTPGEMLAQPELKKQAWKTLQTVMQYLQTKVQL